MPWWLVVLLVLLVGCGLITAAKGQWGFLLLGLVFLGVFWPLTAAMPAREGSLWARSRGRRRRTASP
jgi:hypothetical protein